MACATNGYCGHEAEIPAARSASRKRVVVIGGGPAGMEAARIAAARGHDVILYERHRHLGGALVMAATVHAENEPLLDHLIGALARSSVEVRLGREAQADEIVAMRPDAVVVATGGDVVVPEISGAGLPHVLSGSELRAMLCGELPASSSRGRALWQRAGARRAVGLLQRFVHPRRLRALSRAWMPIGRRVVIVGADLAAVELAEFLAARGRRVAVVDSAVAIAAEVGPKRRGEHMDRLDRLGVSVQTGVRVERILRDAVIVSPHAGAIPADTVILAGEVRASMALSERLAERLPVVHAIGDCTGLGLIKKAIAEATVVAGGL